ncbi:MAG: hypothetical protein IJ364_08165, partial [Oscillospiraceae bacterium]|nr:hypothetical protein [Oscillospiraceae bacterium]
MKKRVLFLAMALVMLLGSFSTAYAAHTHEIKSKYSVKPTEAKKGIICYYCKDKDCDYYYEVEVPRLPDIYVNKYRHSTDGLRARITAAQNFTAKNGEINI